MAGEVLGGAIESQDLPTGSAFVRILGLVAKRLGNEDIEVIYPHGAPQLQAYKFFERLMGAYKKIEDLTDLNWELFCMRSSTLGLQPKDLKKIRDQMLFQVQSELSTTDILTGLTNRREGDRQLRAILHTMLSMRKGAPQTISVAVFDIDHFKNINDTLGHDGGDKVLVQVANLMRELFREEDVICRYGGEEFVLAAVNRDDTKNRHDIEHAIADKRSRLSQITVKVNENEVVSVTISGGMVTYSQAGLRALLIKGRMNESSLGDQLEYLRTTLIKEADKWMYQAKDLGRNRLCTEDEVYG